MKAMFISIALIFSQLISFSQVDDNNWVLYRSIDGIEIHTQEINCFSNEAPAQKAIIIKVVNHNKDNYRIEWDLSVWYNNEKSVSNIKDGENHHSIDLAGNQTIQGSCDAPYGPFYIFKDFITYVSPTKLTSYELENIRITKI